MKSLYIRSIRWQNGLNEYGQGMELIGATAVAEHFKEKQPISCGSVSGPWHTERLLGIAATADGGEEFDQLCSVDNDG